MIKSLIFSIALCATLQNPVYYRTRTETLLVEISTDSRNRCLNNLLIQNLSSSKCRYFIRVWVGRVWMFRHELDIDANETRYYDDAFIICDKDGEVSVEIVKIDSNK